MPKSHRLARLHATLRRELRTRAKRRVDELLKSPDPDSPEHTMADALLAHVAMGYEVDIDIAVQVLHPEGPERRPNVTSAQTEIVSA